jgi:SAM-dependent methyltransferase
MPGTADRTRRPEPVADDRSYETHWQMNPVSRGVFDRATDAAVEALGDRTPLVVLDVGCGRQSNVVFPTATDVIGVDVDRTGLASNQTLTRRVFGDAVTTPVPESSVDAVACIFTLEHVRSPEVVFGKLARALRPGGVLVIAVPHVRSPKAVVTKRTPQAFHEWFYRRILGRTAEGEGIPFETVLDPAIRPDRLRRLAGALGLEVVFEEEFEDNKQRQVREKLFVKGALWKGIRVAMGLVLRHDPARTDYAAVYRRPEGTVTGELADTLAEVARDAG